MKIKVNMNMLDRSLRIVGSLFLIYLGFFNTGIIANGVINLLLGSFGVLNLASAVVGFCPIYYLANLSTCRNCTPDQH